jgi:beta-lactamase regulating signal transducer with metallopeptidase domain
MDTLLHLGLSNAVMATVLALVAGAAALVLRRRPALVHAVWLLVLVKLVTPPIVRLPAPWRGEPVAEVPAETPAAPEEAKRDSERLFIALPDDAAEHLPPGDIVVQPASDRLPEPELAENGLAIRAAHRVEAVVPAPAVTVPASALAPVAETPRWLIVMGMAWAAGSLAWFVLAAIRIARFRRLLRFASDAPPRLQARACRLAERLGLRRCPPVRLLPGRLSPMLWAAGGGPQLLVPVGLLDVVRVDQLDTILLHELAHLRRRDHWVRTLEFVALGLYWWHPAVWWTRRELREAEEQCCDAWVVSMLEGSPRSYAEALVETLDFLAQPAPMPPPLASGMDRVTDLKRRLTMILSGTTPRAMTWRGGLTMLGLAALLPLLPAWVRAEPPNPEQQLLEAKKALDRELQAARDAAVKAEEADRSADIKQLEAEIQKRAAEIKDLTRRLQELKAQLAGPMPMRPGAGAVALPGFPGAPPQAWDALPKGATGKRVVILQHDDRMLGAALGQGVLYELVPGEKGTLILRPIQKPVMPPRAIEAAPPALPGRPGGSGADLEKRLEAILRELEDLRQEMRSKPRTPGVKPPTKLDAKPEDETRLKLENALEVADALRKKKLNLETHTAEALVPLRLETEALRDQLRLTDREAEDAHVRLKALEDEFESALRKVNEQAKPELVKRFADQRDAARARAEDTQKKKDVLREKSEHLKLKTDAIARDRDAAIQKIEQELKLAEEAASRARKALDELPRQP